MKVLAILGSGRTNGNSRKTMDAVIDGIDKNRNTVETVYLSRLKTLKQCIGCDSCRKESDECALKDDLIEVIEKTRQADAVVVASPVYYFGLNSLVKSYIDRAFYSSEGKNGKRSLLAGKRFAFTLTFGDTDVFTSGGINAINTIKDIAKFVGLDLAGIVYGSTPDDRLGPGGEMLDECRDLGKKLTG